MTGKITIKGADEVTIEPGAAPVAKERWDGETVTGVLLKSDSARRITWHVFYPANKADVGKALDGHRDFASREVVELGAHEYLLKHRKVGILHADGTEGSGDLVESAIHHGPDWVIKAADGTEQTVVDGDWCGAIRWTPETWQEWEAGRLRGVSAQGGAVRRKATPEQVAGLRS